MRIDMRIDAPVCDRFEALLAELGIRVEAAPQDLVTVPETGPVLVVANRPPGGLEEVILAAVLVRARPDVRVLGKPLTSGIAELDEYFVEVDPLAWLKSGGVLAAFPGGEQAEPAGQPAGRWSDAAPRLAALSQAAVVPALLRRQSDSAVEVRLGSPIPARAIAAIPDHGHAASYLRWRTHLLARRGEAATRLVPRLQRSA
jgi:putative hemolysin